LPSSKIEDIERGCLSFLRGATQPVPNTPCSGSPNRRFLLWHRVVSVCDLVMTIPSGSVSVPAHAPDEQPDTDWAARPASTGSHGAATGY
jgi:hypothetical protein